MVKVVTSRCKENSSRKESEAPEEEGEEVRGPKRTVNSGGARRSTG